MKRSICSLGVVVVGTVLLFGLGGCACGDEGESGLVSSDAGQDGNGAIVQGVVGRVTAVDGRPIEGAFVQARSLGAEGPAVPDIGIFSSRDGQYSWPLSPGSFELSVSAEGFEAAKERVTVRRGKLATRDFVLQPVR